MKDKLGLYYYPFPDNKRVRMYVREILDKICFKFWNADAHEIWDKQRWVAYDEIVKATAAYKDKKRNPIEAYDIEVAKQLINEDRKEHKS
ncbi:MAG: hypothetical protein MUO43_14175 [Desulfobacterales bacterium]|nr:hypothetical protein [Desulfobacterales bacterium]